MPRSTQRPRRDRAKRLTRQASDLTAMIAIEEPTPPTTTPNQCIADENSPYSPPRLQISRPVLSETDLGFLLHNAPLPNLTEASSPADRLTVCLLPPIHVAPNPSNASTRHANLVKESSHLSDWRASSSGTPPPPALPDLPDVSMLKMGTIGDVAAPLTPNLRAFNKTSSRPKDGVIGDV